VLHRVGRCYVLFLGLVVMGCSTLSPAVKNPAVDMEVKGVDFHDVVKAVDTLDLRVGEMETGLAEVTGQVALLVASTDVTTERISALTSSVNAGMFSGSGFYAFAALLAVLVAQLGAYVLWWKLRRDVKNNNQVKSVSPDASAATRPVPGRSPLPV